LKPRWGEAELGAMAASTPSPWLPALWRVGGPFLGLALVTGLFALNPEIREVFLSGQNLRFVLTQTVIVAIAALGMTLIIVSGGIDLSVGSSIALSSVAAAVLLRAGVPPVAAVGAAVGTGAILGLFAGTLVSTLRIAPFIVTLGLLGVARGLAKWLAGERTVSIPETWVSRLMTPLPEPAWLVLAPGVWVAVLLALFIAVLLRGTVFGRHLFAIGSNEAAARLCGVRVGRMKPMIYLVAGACFGLAGLMQLARLRQGDPTAASGLELDVIAAVVIGGASLSGGTGSVVGSMVGALTMAVLRNGSQQMGWPTYMQEILIGTVIVLAVTVDRLRQGKAG